MSEDLTKCPQCGGEADNGIDRCIPPSAYMCSKCCAQEEAERQAALQESEAGTNLRIPPNAKRIEIKCFDCDGFEIGIGEGTGIETTGYLAPPEVQESEAGAAPEPYATFVRLGSCGGFRLVFHKEEPAENVDLYLAPPSAQAIETAAIMKCVELAGWDGNVHQSKLLELIPQDGRTQLEQKCMEVANAAFDFGYYDCESPAVDCVEPKLRAIVTNLIGAAK